MLCDASITKAGAAIVRKRAFPFPRGRFEVTGEFLNGLGHGDCSPHEVHVADSERYDLLPREPEDASSQNEGLVMLGQLIDEPAELLWV